ncbi:MAG TPA: hypothetical protein VK962_06260 [Actinomycetota bacterium]|jgi:hypothetical protein|nr:hypothetical protein [Actinomycetota bacterium]
MSERPTSKRASKRELRAWAWIAGALAFLAPWTAIAANPKPATAVDGGRAERPVKIIHRITRRVVIRDPVEDAGVRYVYVGGGSSSSSSSTSSSGASGSAGGSPSTSTGGS